MQQLSNDYFNLILIKQNEQGKNQTLYAFGFQPTYPRKSLFIILSFKRYSAN